MTSVEDKGLRNSVPLEMRCSMSSIGLAVWTLYLYGYEPCPMINTFSDTFMAFFLPLAPAMEQRN
jgi:hypothetical protein